MESSWSSVEAFVRMRISQPCGVTVPSSICQAVGHFGKLFGFQMKPMPVTLSEAIAKHEQHRNEPKKALEYSPVICAGLESIVCDEDQPLVDRFRAWVERIRVGASMRWGDTQASPTWAIGRMRGGIFCKTEETKTAKPMDGIAWVCSEEHFRSFPKARFDMSPRLSVCNSTPA